MVLKGVMTIELTDENYSGAAFAEFYVIKATLTPQYGYIPNYTVEYSDVINDLRIGGSVESSAGAGGVLTVFEGFFTITGILVRGADGSVTVAELPDNYNALPVNSEALLENVRVAFSPDVNEDVYLKNFRPFESNYTLTVTRKTSAAGPTGWPSGCPMCGESAKRARPSACSSTGGSCRP